MAARARVLSRPGVDVLRQWQAEPRSTGFAAQPAARRAGALYAAALAASQLRDHAGARALLAPLQAVVQGDAPAQRQVQLLAAELALAAGDVQAARQALSAGGGAASSPDRPTLLLRTQVLLRAGQAQDMAGPLQTWLATHPRDAGAWQLLASVWQAQGQVLRSVRAEAEAHAARYDYAAAVDRFKAGQDVARKGSAPADFVEASIIDTRLRAVEALAREQAQQAAER